MSEHNNPIPVAVAIIPTATVTPSKIIKHGFIAQVRAIPPAFGGKCLPSGYLNKLETAEEAVAREVKEEMGFETDPQHWSLITTRVTPNNRLLIFMLYIGEVFNKDFKDLPPHVPNAEVSDRVMVMADDELAFPLHSEVLKAITAV